MKTSLNAESADFDVEFEVAVDEVYPNNIIYVSAFRGEHPQTNNRLPKGFDGLSQLGRGQGRVTLPTSAGWEALGYVVLGLASLVAVTISLVRILG